MAGKKNGNNKNNKGRLFSVLAIVLVIIAALAGYGWYSGTFSNLTSSKPTQVVQEVLGQSKDKLGEVFSNVKKSDVKNQENKDKETKGDKDGKASTKTGSKGSNNDAEKANRDREAKSASTVPKGHARMAIVLDDFGYSIHVAQKYNALPIPLTYAVFPHKQYTKEVAQSGYASGKEIMLHLPMESMSNTAAEKTTIRTSMSDEEIRRITASAIEDIPHIIGVNNHQGSLASADARVVRDVAGVIKNYGLFFLDSRTNGQSKIYSISKSMGIPTNANELFLDNSSDIDTIKSRLQQAADIAFSSDSKSIIVIGHDRPNTYLAIKEMYRILEAQGIEFVFVSSMMY